MPTVSEILSTATVIANEWRWLAVSWHLLMGAGVVALAAGWRPPKWLAGILITPLLISVSVLAWWSSNPFTGTVFLFMTGALVVLSARLPVESIRFGPRWIAAFGMSLMAFGWLYPHFLNTASWVQYLYAAPLGLLPCPTLIATIGFALVVDGLNSRPWAMALASVGLLYGAIGVFTLGVALDVALLAGAIMLMGVAIANSTARASERRRILSLGSAVPQSAAARPWRAAAQNHHPPTQGAL